MGGPSIVLLLSGWTYSPELSLVLLRHCCLPAGIKGMLAAGRPAQRDQICVSCINCGHKV